MCDPMTIAGIALSGIGAGANYLGQQQVQSARNDALAAERIRQGQLDQEAAALNTRSQDRYTDFSQKQDEKAKSLADMYTAQPAALPETAPLMPQSSSNITVSNETAKRAQAKDRTDQIGTALGNLRAFGDVLGDTSRLQGRDASQVGQIGGFKKGSSNVLAYELEDANNAAGALPMLGTIASGLGRIGVGAGLSGANLFGGAGSIATSANPMASRALGGAVDRASVPGYAAASGSRGLFSLFGG